MAGGRRRGGIRGMFDSENLGSQSERNLADGIKQNSAGRNAGR